MFVPSRCPSETTIVEFLREQLPPRRQRRVQCHTDLCLACGELVAALRTMWPIGSKPRMPQRRGRYRIETLLRSTPLGRVFRAHDPQSGEAVAVHCIEHAMSPMPQALQLRTLGRRLYNADPIGFVPVIDAGRDSDGEFAVMPLVEATTLREHLDCDASGWRRVARLCADAAQVLGRAHRYGLAHGSLSLDTILIGRNEQIRIADFGFPSALPPRALPAKVAAVAPEAHAGRRTPRADQFAFGTMLYEALYASAPFRGATQADILTATLSGPPALPARKPGGTALWEVVARCLAIDPRDRWADLGVVASQLRSLSRGPLSRLGQRLFAPATANCDAA